MAGGCSSGSKYPRKRGYGLSGPGWEFRIQGLGFKRVGRYRVEEFKSFSKQGFLRIEMDYRGPVLWVRLKVQSQTRTGRFRARFLGSVPTLNWAYKLTDSPHSLSWPNVGYPNDKLGYKPGFMWLLLGGSVGLSKQDKREN